MHGFTQIIGQPKITAHLQKALRTGNISHAYLLTGERESGAEWIAEAFSAALQCEHPVEKEGLLEACGTCLSCAQAQSGSQPDIIWTEHAKPNTIGVDDIRKMRSDVQIKPYRSEHKIYIVRDAQKMTPQAQNALLKTLEEPPAYAVILLLADGPGTFLPTVLSRCILLQMQPVPETALTQWLEREKGIPAGKAALYAGFAGGSLGRAATLAEDPAFGELCAETVEMLRRLPTMDSHDIAQAAASLAGREDDLAAVLSFLQTWYRDVLLCKALGEADHLIFAEEVQYSKEAAARISYEGLQKITEAFDLAARRRKAGGNAALILELLFLEIRAQQSGK
ncbi:MAG: DNA polymerase III subunit [Eubacteriales bacterium]|nr:DNA polymerase III subunit [Eubacteriales bacterium]